MTTEEKILLCETAFNVEFNGDINNLSEVKAFLDEYLYGAEVIMEDAFSSAPDYLFY